MNRYEGYPTLNTTMRLYKAAVELEKLLLKYLLPFATGPFNIQVKAMRRATFDTHYERTEADSDNHFTRKWLNKDTAGRVYDWITTIVPMFTRSWMPDNAIKKLVGYNPRHDKQQRAEEALKTSNDNLVFVIFTGEGHQSVTIVDKQKFLEIDQTETRRRPCKLQSTGLFKDANKLLDNTIVLDLQLGFTQQVLVRKSLLSHCVSLTHAHSGRVYCVFPSFDKFPGLWGDAADVNVVGALHCNPDADINNPTTFFRTSGLTRSGGETLHTSEVDSCQPGEGVFRMRSSNGCFPPYEENEEKYLPQDDLMCCELHPREDKNAQVLDELRIFGNRTRDPTRQRSELIQEAFKWFFEEIGIDGPISINTDFDENDTDDTSEIYEMDTLDAFRAYMPNCSELRFRFKTEQGRDKAIECMREASRANIVHNVTFFVSMTLPHPPMVVPDPFPPHPDTKTLEMAKIPPQNNTHIVFTERNHPPRRTVFMQLEMWMQTEQNRQVGIKFKSVPVYSVDRAGGEILDEIPYHTHKGVVGVFKSRQYTTISSRNHVHLMKKNHVEVTVDTMKLNGLYYTVVRLRAGTKRQIQPRGKGKAKASAEGKGKRKLVFDSDGSESN